MNILILLLLLNCMAPDFSSKLIFSSQERNIFKDACADKTVAQLYYDQIQKYCEGKSNELRLMVYEGNYEDNKLMEGENALKIFSADRAQYEGYFHLFYDNQDFYLNINAVPISWYVYIEKAFKQALVKEDSEDNIDAYQSEAQKDCTNGSVENIKEAVVFDKWAISEQEKAILYGTFPQPEVNAMLIENIKNYCAKEQTNLKLMVYEGNYENNKLMEGENALKIFSADRAQYNGYLYLRDNEDDFYMPLHVLPVSWQKYIEQTYTNSVYDIENSLETLNPIALDLLRTKHADIDLYAIRTLVNKIQQYAQERIIYMENDDPNNMRMKFTSDNATSALEAILEIPIDGVTYVIECKNLTEPWLTQIEEKIQDINIINIKEAQHKARYSKQKPTDEPLRIMGRRHHWKLSSIMQKHVDEVLSAVIADKDERNSIMLQWTNDIMRRCGTMTNLEFIVYKGTAVITGLEALNLFRQNNTEYAGWFLMKYQNVHCYIPYTELWSYWQRYLCLLHIMQDVLTDAGIIDLFNTLAWTNIDVDYLLHIKDLIQNRKITSDEIDNNIFTISVDIFSHQFNNPRVYCDKITCTYNIALNCLRFVPEAANDGNTNSISDNVWCKQNDYNQTFTMMYGPKPRIITPTKKEA